MPLSGKEILKMFINNGWYIKRKSKGDHIQIGKIVNGKEINETIPMHKELKKGTESALLKRIKETK